MKRYSFIVGLLMLVTVPAQAQMTLDKVLAQLDSYYPPDFIATVNGKTYEQNGKGKKAFIKEGDASVGIRVENDEVKLIYSAKLVQKLEEEAMAVKQDPDAKRPNTLAIGDLTINELSSIYRPAFNLRKELKSLELKEIITLEDGTYMLDFAISQDSLSKEESKYIKKLDGHFQLTVDSLGNPIKSKFEIKAKGSAFIFIKFSVAQSLRTTYRVMDKQLRVLQSVYHDTSSGMSEYFVQSVEYNVSY